MERDSDDWNGTQAIDTHSSLLRQFHQASYRLLLLCFGHIHLAEVDPVAALLNSLQPYGDTRTIEDRLVDRKASFEADAVYLPADVFGVVETTIFGMSGIPSGALIQNRSS
jgi:hypothetical protein